MQIRISTRHGNVSDATQEKITAKVEKLTRIFERLTEISVTVDLEHRDAPSVDVRVSAEHKHDFVAAAQSEELMAALDLAMHKLEQQLRGPEVSVSEFRGKWVVLNYWATWCAPCRKEIPDLSELHAARSDVVVLGLAFEDTEIENFNEFLVEFNPSYPILLVDVYAPPEPFGAPKVLPTTIILDTEGVPVKTFLGPVKGEDITSFIDNH